MKVISQIFKTIYHDFLEMFQPIQKQQTVGRLFIKAQQLYDAA